MPKNETTDTIDCSFNCEQTKCQKIIHCRVVYFILCKFTLIKKKTAETRE